MPVNKSYLSRPENARFTRVWRSMFTHARLRWLDYWNLFYELQEQKAPLKIKALPESIARWCSMFDDEGHEKPLIVGAAAGIRREFMLMVAMALPEEGVDPPRCSDPSELAIANCSDSERGIKIALTDISEVKELLMRTRPEWKINNETELKSIVELLEQEFESRLRQLEEFGQVKPKRIILQPLADAGHILAQADRINKATIEGFAFGAMEKLNESYVQSLGPDANFWRAYGFSSGQPMSGKDYLIGAIGFKEEPGQHVRL